MSVLQSQCYQKQQQPQPMLGSGCGSQVYMGYSIHPSELRGCVAMPRAGLRQPNARKSLDSALNQIKQGSGYVVDEAG